MKKLMVAAAGAAALFIASSLPVLADEATGSIASIDLAAGSVSLDNGKVYRLPTTVALADFKVGQKVKITFDAVDGGAMVASSIMPDEATGSALAPVGGNAGPTNNLGAPRD